MTAPLSEQQLADIRETLTGLPTAPPTDVREAGVQLLAEVERLRAERDAFADRVDTLTAVAKSNKRHVQAMGAELPAAESRGRALGHVAGLREAAEMVDVDDDCGCGGCDSCTSRQDAARIRAHADLLTAALGGIAGGGR